jgi:hypothetical protein
MKLKKKESQQASVTSTVVVIDTMYASQDAALHGNLQKTIICPMIFGFATVEPVDTTVNSRKVHLMFREICDGYHGWKR